MADVKISELTPVSELVSDDILVCVDVSSGTTGTTYKITTNNLFRLPGLDGLGNGTYQGLTISGVLAGETIPAWTVVYLKAADSRWYKADADGSGTWPARGLSVEAGTAGNAMRVLVLGVVRYDTWTWTAASTLYLTDDLGTYTYGISHTAPSGSGDCIQVVGFALSDDEAFFNFTGVYAEVE